MTRYNRYQDYVIRNGKFIGEFEAMYQDFDDPWNQTKREAKSNEKKIALDFIKKKGFKRIIEFGCGLGDYTSRLKKTAGSALGVDISETAITKARLRHPNTDFTTGDILDFEIIKNYKPDCIVFAEITWYVLDKLAEFRSYISSELSGKCIGFVHLLMTYPEGEQKYGTEYFVDIGGIMRYWKEIDFEVWGETSLKEYNGGKRTFCFGKIR